MPDVAGLSCLGIALVIATLSTDMSVIHGFNYECLLGKLTRVHGNLITTQTDEQYKTHKRMNMRSKQPKTLYT